MRSARVAALVVTGLLSTAISVASAQQTPAPNANAILARVKAVLRSRARPPFVVYTLVRRDSIDGVPDLLNSYSLRIWCRTADSAALSRRTFGATATGPPAFIVPAFDKPVDPGPPTADLLDVIHQAQSPTLAWTSSVPSTASPAVQPLPRAIGSVSVLIETTYLVTYVGSAGDDDHLQLVARRDPEKNRLTDLYVDHVTAEIHRAVARDHLYSEGHVTPERFEIDFGTHADVRVITTIHGQTDYSALDPSDAGIPLHEVTYRFEDLAFPADLPAWYFVPAEYGAHRSEFPN